MEPILFLDKAECSGCGACAAICPQKAIDMNEDVEGFVYPSIKRDLCIKCFLCIKICPFKEINNESER